jgi:hypothetical protein
MGGRRSSRGMMMRRENMMRRDNMMGGRRRSRRSNMMTRRGKRRCWSGGSAPVNDASMLASSRLSLSQGGDYLSLHKGQHGGAAVTLSDSAPVGYTGVLDSSMRGAAGILAGDAAFTAASGMSDQAGGGKRNRAAHKKMSRRRKQRGGAAYSLTNAQDVSTPGELLSGRAAMNAAAGQNPEWRYVENPAAYNPRM